MRRLIAVWAIALLVVAPRDARAWNSRGHLTVAEIAFAGLEPATKSKLLSDLKAMQELTYGQGATASNLFALLMSGRPSDCDEDLYLFTRAATFPDMARATGFKDRWHHARWHYVNLPIGPQAGSFEAPKEDPKHRPADLEDMNILQALDYNLSVVAAGTKPADRGLALCWVLHLVGDIHQPLHASTYVSEEFPKGDLGGNLFLVRRSATATKNEKLHLIWDELLGQSESATIVHHLAAGLQALRPRDTYSVAELASREFTAWAKESRALAIRHGYLDSALSGCRLLTPEETGAGCAEVAADAPVLPEGYFETALCIAERRITLAGYRLAALLNERIK